MTHPALHNLVTGWRIVSSLRDSGAICAEVYERRLEALVTKAGALGLAREFRVAISAHDPSDRWGNSARPGQATASIRPVGGA